MSKVEQIDPQVIQKTKDTLRKVISKPALTDKLLNRPPFRYLHDILTEVIRATGFLEGLYSADELNITSIQDKEQKMAFLQKAIDATIFATGEQLKAKTSRIVAGQECDKTNEFLQAVATAVLRKTDSTEAVQKVLSGTKPSDKRKATKDQKPEKEGKKKSEGKRDPKPHEDVLQKGKHSSQQSDPKIEETTEKRRKEKRRDKDAKSSDREGLSNKRRDQGDGKGVNTEEKEVPKTLSQPSQPNEEDTLQVESGSDQQSHAPLRPPSAKGGRRKHASIDDMGGSDVPTNRDNQPEGDDRGKEIVATSEDVKEQRPIAPDVKQDDVIEEGPGVTLQDQERSSTPPLPPMALATQVKRPGSARPAPPKVLRHQASQDSTQQKASSTGVVAPRLILDTGKGDEEEEEEVDKFVTESVPLVEQSQLAHSTEEIDPSKVGALARTMIETKERLEGELTKDKHQDISIGGPRISEAERRKQRELVSKEIEKLQTGVQALCRSTTPLGKIVDYVQEDIESMQKELEMWKKQNNELTETLSKEEMVTEQELQPFKTQLGELEAQLLEQVELITTSKVNIRQNDEKIQQMLQTMSFAVQI